MEFIAAVTVQFEDLAVEKLLVVQNVFAFISKKSQIYLIHTLINVKFFFFSQIF